MFHFHKIWFFNIDCHRWNTYRNQGDRGAHEFARQISVRATCIGIIDLRKHKSRFWWNLGAWLPLAVRMESSTAQICNLRRKTWRPESTMLHFWFWLYFWSWGTHPAGGTACGAHSSVQNAIDRQAIMRIQCSWNEPGRVWNLQHYQRSSRTKLGTTWAFRHFDTIYIYIYI